MAPGAAALSIAPRFAALPPGSPIITLATIQGRLISPAGDTVAVTARFQGDSAVLDFNVKFSGSSAVFTLELSAFDAGGVLAYQASQKVTLKPGNNSGVSPVLVYAAPDAAVTALHVVPNTLTLGSGTGGGVTVSGTNAGGQSVAPIRVGWTSRNPAVATVDDAGNVQAGAFQGTTWIVARTATNLADSAQVKVHAPVDKVTAAPATVQVARGLTVPVAAELRDAGGNLIDDRSATWTTSAPTIATVSPDGVITGVKIGTATVTAAAEGKTASVAVTVTTPLDHVEVTPTAVNLASLHEAKPLTVKLVPKTNGSTDGITPTYKSDNENVATVDASGVVSAVKNGTATITVTADGLTTTSIVTVKQVTASVTVTPKSASVSAVGQVINFTAVALDALGSVVDGATTVWTVSDPTVATIVDGKLVALKAGSVTVTATVDGKTDTGGVNVAPTAALLLLYSTKLAMTVGATATVTAKFGDINGNAITPTTATYSTTTPNVASVSPSGVVTALAPGTAHIVGSAGALTGAINIAVVSAGGGGVTLTPGSVEKLPGSSQNFTVSGGVGPFTATVNGIAGGNATYGYAGVEGNTLFYSAPATVPSPATFDVCAVQDSPSSTGCAHVTISPIPSSGADVIVINDQNMLQDSYIGTADNRQFFKNIVGFTPTGIRASAAKVVFQFGHGTLCTCDASATSILRADALTAGVSAVVDDYTSTLTTIAPDVRVLFLADPTSGYTTAELNVLKQFAAEGGRIVFLGENGSYYGSYIPLENSLLAELGGALTNEAALASCTYGWTIDSSHLNPHQITTGVSSLSIPCASPITLGPDDYAIAFAQRDDNGLYAPVVAVAKIDLTPNPISAAAAATRKVPATSLLRRRTVAKSPVNATPVGGDRTGLGPGVPPGAKSPQRKP